MNPQIALQRAIQSRLDSIRIRYPNYSVRAMAKKAGVSPATLSLLLQGKRKVSPKLAQLLSERLSFDPQERSEVLATYLTKKVDGSKKTPAYVQLSMDQYQLISDWRAFAVLNLLRVEDFKNDVDWIARRLGLQQSEVVETLDRLKRLGMLEESKGQLVRTEARYRTTEDIKNASLKKSHEQTLELAARSLERDPVELRDFSWVTFPLDLAKLPLAKTAIRKFQDDLLALVDEDAKPKEVYRLAIQLFSLTKLES